MRARGTRIARAAVVVGALAFFALACGGGSGGGGAREIPLLAVAAWQLDFEVDDVYFQENSRWGGIEVAFAEPIATAAFLNLSAEGVWALRNLPVPVDRGATDGDPQRVWSFFDLDVPPGTPVDLLSVAVSLTTKPLEAPPGPEAVVPVGASREAFSSGELGELVVPALAPVPAIWGWGKIEGVGVCPGTFPNQEAQESECVPAAVSNSLQYLNNRQNLGLAPSQVDIAAAKGMTGWAPGGAPNDNNPPPWWDRKATAAGQPPYGLTTTQRAQDGTEADRIADFDATMADVAAGKDVEIRIPGHAACVRGIVKVKDAAGNVRYGLVVVHDTDQKNAGGTKAEVVTYDPKTNKFSGGWLFDGSTHDRFVTESK